MTPKNNQAFTLVELLTVISIIAILAGLIFTVLQGSRDKAKLAGCASNLRQIGISLELYAQDNRGFYPSSTATNGTWSQVLAGKGYVQDKKILRCPGDTLNNQGELGRSYAYCSPVMNSGAYSGDRPLKKMIITAPAKQYLLIEWHGASQRWDTASGWIADWTLGASSVSPSHSAGGRHALYVDGHVGWRTLQKVNDPQSGWLLNDITRP